MSSPVDGVGRSRSLEVVAIIPARDEIGSIAETIRALAAVGSVERVVVVDDGSVDGTARAAEDGGAEVIRLPRATGKGGAMERGIDAGTADVFVFADGDLGSSAAGLEQVLRPVLAGEADVAIAVLPPQEGGGFGFVKRMARWLILRASGAEMAAPLSGQRALTASALDSVRPLARGFGVEVAMTIDAVRAGQRVLEVPTDLRHTPPGRTLAGVLHRARQGSDIIRAGLPRVVRQR